MKVTSSVLRSVLIWRKSQFATVVALGILLVPMGRIAVRAADLNVGYLAYLSAKTVRTLPEMSSCCAFHLASDGTDRIAALAHIGQARVALDSDDPVAAIEVLESDAIARSTQIGSLLLGYAFLAQGNWRQTAVSWRRAGVSGEYILRQPGIPQAYLYDLTSEAAPTSQTYYALGLRFGEDGRISDAITAYETAIQMNSGWARRQDFLITWYRLALALSSSQLQYDDNAESVLRKALALSYEYPNQGGWQILLLRRLAIRAFGQNDFTQTISWLSEARRIGLILSPSDYMLLGKAIYLDTGNTNAACQAFDLALGVQKSDVELTLNIGNFWIENNELALAEIYCSNYQGLNNKTFWQQDICLGMIAFNQSDYNEAYIFLLQALEKKALPTKAKQLSSRLCEISAFAQREVCQP